MVEDGGLHANFFWFLVFFLVFIYLSNFYTQRGAETHEPEIKSYILYWLTQPGVPANFLLKDQIVNRLAFVGDTVSVAATELCSY